MIDTGYQSKEFLGRVAENRACPGVFIFDNPMKVVWADRRGWELCRRFHAHQGTKIQGKEPNGRIPKMLKELVSKAIGSLKEGQQKKSLDSPLLRKAITGANGSLSVCVFALPGEDREAYRLLVLVEQIGRCEEAAARQAKDIFGLTQREVQVMQHLLKGWSNKAIAYELKVAEQTVKEHLQRIMAKTKSSSRAGILCRVLLL